MNLSSITKDVASLVAFGKDFLCSQGVPYPEREARYLLLSLLNISYDQARLSEEPISEIIQDRFYRLLKKRGQRQPLLYLEGKTNFYNLDLCVAPGVFIPRQETELLVDRICLFLRDQGSLHDKNFYDMCCGSGCIGLAIKKTFPEMTVVLSDISEDAVWLAKKNADKNNLFVEILQGHLFEPFQDMPCDYFCCNPPYLSYKSIFHTDQEVRRFEPWIALVGGSTGTEFYSEIAPCLVKNLKKSGAAWMEIGYDQGASVKEIFKKFKWEGTVSKDFSNNDRFFFLEGDKRDVYSK